ncbi:MAG: phosphotransferase [Candidatus Baltobacteraceae bacterium]
MLPQWHPETKVTADLARSLIHDQLPELRPLEVEPLGAGWDNAAFVVNGRYVFRFPQRAIAAPLVKLEADILPLIAADLPLPIPVPTFRGGPAGDYPWMFAGYEAVRGVTACSVSLSDDQRAALAAPLATFLRHLHAIDTAKAMRSGLQVDVLGRMEHAKRFPATEQRFTELYAAGLTDDGATFLNTMADISPNTGEGRQVLVHGDLYARHVLVNDATVSGVIDWGDMHLGNPAIDLRIAFLMLPPQAHAAFRQAYGTIDNRTWELARYSAIYSAVLVLHYGNRINDKHLIDIGNIALNYLSHV